MIGLQTVWLYAKVENKVHFAYSDRYSFSDWSYDCTIFSIVYLWAVNKQLRDIASSKFVFPTSELIV